MAPDPSQTPPAEPARRRSVSSAILYVIGQLIGYAFEFAAYWALLFSLPAGFAHLAARVFSSSAIFIFHRSVTFRADKRQTARQTRRFVILWVINVVVTSLLIDTLSRLSGQPLAAKIAVDGAAFVVNYFAFRFWVFGSDRGVKQSCADR